MRFRRPCLSIFLALCMACLFGCSRESSIRENVNLRNNHSVVFAFNKPFENAEAFADSIINLSNPDSVLVYDTLTITVNDTVYLMGFLRYNSDKVYRYIWHFEEPYDKDNKDTLKKDCEFYSQGETGKGCNYVTENSANATPFARVYTATGLYSPLFIAIDGNNARDTAGIGQYIRVINTPPYLNVPKDTLWTRSKGEITFPMVALDSFGTITSLKIDLDASGKGEPQKWQFEQLGGDTLSVTIKYDSTKVDSLGNQKIYVIAIDDDGNETKDSVNLHFNQLPKLKLISPDDNSTQNEKERLILHYEATDLDNPAALRYFVRAANPIQSDTSIEEFVPNFTNRYLVAENIKESYFVAVDADGNNKLNLTGRIYWDVWVTDGYDTVYADKVKDADGTKRPRMFLLVDLKNPYGVFMGHVQYQGRSRHSGILVEFKDSVNSYLATTNDKGYYSVNVPSGSYRMIVRDTAGYGYDPDTLPYRHIEVGQTINLGNKVLKDPVEPNVIFDNPIDTLFGRSVEFSGKAEDFGSQVKTVETLLDGESKELSFFGGYNKFTNKWTWRVELDELTDGKHTFEVFATDSAGLKSPTIKHEFIVMASSIRLTVNGKSAAMEKNDASLKFSMKIASAKPMPDSMFFVTNVDKMETIAAKVKADSSAEITLKLEDFPSEMKMSNFYTMTAYTSRKGGSASNSVRFGFLSDKPAAFFIQPGSDTAVSINDNVHFDIEVIANNNDPENNAYTLTWNCGGAETCLAANVTSGDLVWKTKGEHRVVVTITNDDGKKSTDEIVVNVISDPPKVKASTDSRLRQKINSTVEVDVTASDKLGTVNKIKWGCSAQKSGIAAALADHNVDVNPPAREFSTTVTVTLPGEETAYYCAFQAIDDDEETANDTITFQAVADKPYVTINIKQLTLTINDEIDFSFMAGDSLGQVVKYEKTCAKSKEFLNENWLTFNRTTKVTMPNTAGNYYCAIRVTDDDGNTASDTATYNVLRASPTVHVLNNPTVTIKDVVNLDADARDSTQYNGTFLNGSIKKYEWGCGPSGSSINFTYSSNSSPEYSATMPSTAYNDYWCVIQVTDDDGNTARDTSHIKVLLDPPTVTVKRENITVRQGFNIVLDATAHDGYGSIVKYEWSCGTPSTIENNWKTFSDASATWEAPAATMNYSCIVRVTDDDGNTARDTTFITYSTGTPVITVKDELIYVMPGQSFDLSATKNDDVWPNSNVSWYKWQCYYSSNNKAINPEVLYSFIDNIQYDDHGDPVVLFYAFRDSTYTEKGEDIYCVVTAEEISTGMTFSDTTQIKIIVSPPKGVITAADTVYIWSGDSSVSAEGYSFYTTEWGGMNSTMGPIGDSLNQKFNWRFSNVPGGPFEGPKDGSLDTNIAQFYQAFVRSGVDGDQRRFCLDYRDSNATAVNEAFYLRHRAQEVCRKVYFAKAWKNLATDTVLVESRIPTPPVLTVVGNKPLEVYLTDSNKIGSKYYDGSGWTSMDASSFTSRDSIVKLAVANNGTDAFLAVLTRSGKVDAYKSTSGTSAWSSIGSLITESASFVDIAVKNGGATPTVLYIGKTDNLPYYANKNNNNAWTSTKISSNKSREVKGAFSSNGKFVAVYVGNTAQYQGYYALYNSNFGDKRESQIEPDMSSVDLAVDGDYLYIGYSCRDTEKYGPIVKRGTFGSNNISFSSESQFSRPFTEGKLIHSVSIAVKGGKLYAIIDDNGRLNLAQSHAYRLDGTTWKIHGENELPYFKAAFYADHGYYLRGSSPDIGVSSNGGVYISMLGWENAGGRGKNFGPIVMKYGADSWTVH